MTAQNILITTKDFTEKALAYRQLRNRPAGNGTLAFDEVIEVDEGIDGSGTVLQPLTESEINRVLRRVFKFKKAVVYIYLQHSGKNPIHEKILRNLLVAAGIRKVNTIHSKADNSLPAK